MQLEKIAATMANYRAPRNRLPDPMGWANGGSRYRGFRSRGRVRPGILRGAVQPFIGLISKILKSIFSLFLLIIYILSIPLVLLGLLFGAIIGLAFITFTFRKSFSFQIQRPETVSIQDEFEDQINLFISKILQDPLLQKQLLTENATPIAIAKEHGLTIKPYHILSIATLGNELTIPMEEMEEQLKIHFSSNPDLPKSSRLIFLSLGQNKALYYFMHGQQILGQIR